MIIAKALFITWNIVWFIIDPQIGYANLPFTIIFVMGMPNKKETR